MVRSYLIGDLHSLSARMRRDDGGKETEEPEDPFHVGPQSVRETQAQGRSWQHREAQVVRLRGLDFSE